MYETASSEREISGVTPCIVIMIKKKYSEIVAISIANLPVQIKT